MHRDPDAIGALAVLFVDTIFSIEQRCDRGNRPTVISSLAFRHKRLLAQQSLAGLLGGNTLGCLT